MEFNTNIKRSPRDSAWEPKFDISKGLRKHYNIMKSTITQNKS